MRNSLPAPPKIRKGVPGDQAELAIELRGDLGVHVQFSGKDAPQEYFVDLATKPLAAQDFDHWDAVIEPFAELRIGVDIDPFRYDPGSAQHGTDVIAEVATGARVDSDARIELGWLSGPGGSPETVQPRAHGRLR